MKEIRTYYDINNTILKEQFLVDEMERKHGEYNEFRRNGKLKFHYIYNHGQICKTEAFDENGELFERALFVNGKEVKIERSENGRKLYSKSRKNDEDFGQNKRFS